MRPPVARLPCTSQAGAGRGLAVTYECSGTSGNSPVLPRYLHGVMSVGWWVVTGECTVFIRLDNLISQGAEIITALAVRSLYNHGDSRRMATSVGLAAGLGQTYNVCYGCNQPSWCLFAFGDDSVSPRTSSQVVRSGVPSGSVGAIQHIGSISRSAGGGARGRGDGCCTCYSRGSSAVRKFASACGLLYA